VIGAEDADKMVAGYRQALDAGTHTNKTILSNFKPPFAVDWTRYRNTKWNENDDTTLPLAELQMLADRLTTIPANFKIHPRVEKIIADRRLMGQGKMPVDWGMAETSRTPRSSRTDSRSAFPGRTAAAALSFTATRCCTTRTAKSGTQAATSR